MALAQTIRDRLTLPAVVAPMFLCSSVAMAAEACKAGIIGSLTRNHLRDNDEYLAELRAVADDLARFRDTHPDRPVGPLAVNLSRRVPDEEMRLQVEMARDHGAEILITASGDPTWCTPIIRDAGMLHWHDATSVRFAEKAIKAGVDGIIAIGAGGGGHSGGITHLALIPEIRAIFAGTIVLAGAVSNGATIRAAEILGADLSYLGTRFIATQESRAPDDYKAMLVAAKAGDTLYTDAINGVPANWLKPSLLALGMDPAALPRPQGRGTGHLPEGVKPWVNLYSAGHGVSLIDDIPPVADLVARLRAEYVAACVLPDMAAQARG